MILVGKVIGVVVLVLAIIVIFVVGFFWILLCTDFDDDECPPVQRREPKFDLEFPKKRSDDTTNVVTPDFKKKRRSPS